MKSLICISLALGLASCSSVCPKQQAEVLVPVKVLPLFFKDGAPVEETKLEGKFYIRHGMDGDKKNCHISRTPVEDYQGVLMMKFNGMTESCTGDHCSYCDFKSSGGCECKNSTGTCNHTVTRNSDLLKVQ